MPPAPPTNTHPSFIGASESYEEVNRLVKYKNDAFAEAKQFVETIDQTKVIQ